MNQNTSIEYGMEQLAQNVTGITVINSEHWFGEEQPDVVVKLLNNFFSASAASMTLWSHSINVSDHVFSQYIEYAKKPHALVFLHVLMLAIST